MKNLFKENRIRQFIYIFLLLFIFSSCDKEPDEPVVPVIFSIDNNSIEEGDDGNTELSFTVKINQVADEEVRISYSTQSASASEDSDFVAKNGFVSLSPGETESEIFIEIIGDNNLEEDELFEVVLSNPVNADVSASRGTGVGTIINDDDSTPILDIGYTTPTSYPGLSLVWADEFDGDLLSDDWIYEVGNGNSGWGNNELQNYVAGTSNATVADGWLTIEARKNGNNFTSARIKTQGSQSFQYGRVDIRARLPQGQGIWPALWMLGDNITTVGWPASGEIDIMELVGHEPNKVHGTVHWEDQGSNANFGGSRTLSSGIFADEFHVFTITWDSQRIRWFLDDIQYHVIDITGSELSEFHQKFYFIFNVAVGGNWPGSPDATTNFPQTMIVDYVRVFQ